MSKTYAFRELNYVTVPKHTMFPVKSLKVLQATLPLIASFSNFWSYIDNIFQATYEQWL